ncbi:HAD-IIB family hydrolase [Gordonia desulfuricans]|uniref:phosphomannomutase n=1 Tax=Gordonia desulfuricans TaxID=89051 RepID=A0A7K3LRI1_9ACTN|nr:MULTISPECIES: HAD-IIB family hydrolase [Gordonia]EMP13870.1 HAD family hydrolase [Gordonia sp. NB41Y]NDK90864.1 HAD-IIB family hydrolase [Gordonia desulfuricans]WLP91127.1 HAD-IIB family hydrolase [Gordonia sp. NB41Y]
MTVTYGDREYRLVMFDLDDTLAPSKSPLDDQMVTVLRTLLGEALVCIISGGRYEQFRMQVLDRIGDIAELDNLHLMPTCGTQYVRRNGTEWETVYAEDLTDDEKQRTLAALETGAKELGVWETETWGPILEDRGSQITFSALGQSAPVDAKKAWDPDGAKKAALRAYAAERLPDLEVRSGGSTSVDVTRKGIDKAYGAQKLMEILGLGRDDILFYGDRLDEGGNDRPVLDLGITSVAVDGWEDTHARLVELLGR